MNEYIKEKEKRENKIKKYVDAGILSKTTLYETFSDIAEKFGDKIAVIDDEKEVSYIQLKHFSDKLAAYFYFYGIKKGDAVGVQLHNCILFAEVCFALWKIGAVPVLLMPSLRINDLAPVFNKIEPVAYIGSDFYMGFDYRGLGSEITQNFSSVKLLFFKNDLESVLDDEKEFDYIDKEMPEVLFTDPAVALLSSGTTGDPKLILRTHSEYVFSVINGYLRVKETPEDTYLLSVPVQHIFGFAQPGMLGALFSGAKLVMTSSVDVDEILELAEENKVTVMGMVPSMLGLMAEIMQWSECDISSVRIILTGGAPLSPKLRRTLVEDCGVKILQGYGFSEGLVATNLIEDDERIASECQGRPISKFDIIKIVDENGDEVPQGEAGELLADGPNIITGYYNNENLTKEVFRSDGFYCSGDFARITKEGNIQVLGRVREQINRCGEKIMPSEIEKILSKYPKVAQVVVVGVPHEDQGQTVCAFIVASNGDLTMKELNQFMQEKGISNYKHLEYMYLIDKIPLTAVGKPDRKALETLAIKKSCKEV